MTKKEYRFVREHEDDVKEVISTDLEEFKAFCHYSSLSDWTKHKKSIELHLEAFGFYAFTGNDVKYYIITK